MIVILLTALMLAIGSAVQAREDGLPVKRLPREGQSLRDFLPRGWTIEEQAGGDLDGDGVEDIAAILVQEKPVVDKNGVESELERGVIVLLGKQKGRFRLAGTNNTLLGCTKCLGVKEGVSIGIKKRVVIVGQMSGSREFTDETWRFRYGAVNQRFILIGRDVESGDGMVGTGKIESFNYLTGIKITETYRYDEKSERKITISTKKGKGPKATPFMEDVQMVKSD